MSPAWADHIATYYTRLINRHGHDPRACDYGSDRSQQIKFGALAQVMPLAGKRVLDVGCGFADFADYLQGTWGLADYYGVDITPRMIEEARRLHPNLSLRTLNILEDNPGGPYDLVTANGIFYLLGENAEALMRQLITRMFELSQEAVAFNSLSSWAPRHEPGEFYADPLSIAEFCRSLTPWVVLRHDYLPHDFTIYLYHKARQQ